MLHSYLERNECGDTVKVLGLTALMAYYTFIGDETRYTSAHAMMKEAQSDPDVSPLTRKKLEAEMNDLEAAWYFKAGRPDLALAPLKKRLERGFLVEGKNAVYIINLDNLAQVYRKCGMADLSEETYRKALREAESELKPHIPEHVQLLISNNFAVLFLETGRPAEALEQLARCTRYAKDGAPALGEVYRNYARAWEQLGERDKALRYWMLSAPLLEKLYGTDHERTVYARERVRALEKQTES